MKTITPGMVSKEHLEKFKALYFQKYKIKLSNEETLEQSIALLNLMRILVKPD